MKRITTEEAREAQHTHQTGNTKAKRRTVCIYIYIEREREREKAERKRHGKAWEQQGKDTEGDRET